MGACGHNLLCSKYGGLGEGTYILQRSHIPPVLEVSVLGESGGITVPM